MKTDIRRLPEMGDGESTRRDLIPVCAYCQRVRNEQGDWNQVASEAWKNTSVKLSHSICPNCETDQFVVTQNVQGKRKSE